MGSWLVCTIQGQVYLTFARLLKLPNVTKPLERAGVGQTGPASGDGV